MRRRIRGILMSGKQYSLDSRMDLVQVSLLKYTFYKVIYFNLKYKDSFIKQYKISFRRNDTSERN